MNFFKRYILLRYTLLLVALLLPVVLFIAYSYYNYRLNAIADDVVFSISSINKNTVNRYESMWTWKSMQSKNDRKKLASKFRKELQYLSSVPFIMAEITSPLMIFLFLPIVEEIKISLVIPTQSRSSIFITSASFAIPFQILLSPVSFQ